MRKYILFLSMIYACGKADRSTMGTVRLKSDATTDSIEFVVKEILVAISTNDIENCLLYTSPSPRDRG